MRGMFNFSEILKAGKQLPFCSLLECFAVKLGVEQENKEVDVDFGFFENVENRNTFKLHL